MIKCITLDLDGVYYRKGGLKHFQNYLLENGVSSDLQKKIWIDSSERREFAKGTLTENQFWNFVQINLKSAGIKISTEDMIKNYAAGYKVDTNLFNFCKNLKERGVKIGTCSNLDISLVKSRELNGLEPTFFDFKIYSYVEGLRKPDPKIFLKVIELADCKPSEILYMDDNADRLAPKDLGILNYHYTGFSEFKKWFMENAF